MQMSMLEEKSAKEIKSQQKKGKEKKAPKEAESAEDGQIEEKLDGKIEKKEKKKKEEFGSHGVDSTARVSKKMKESEIDMVEKENIEKLDGRKEKKKKKKKKKKEEFRSYGSDSTSWITQEMEGSEMDMVEKKNSKRKRAVDGEDLEKKEKRSKTMSKGNSAGLEEMVDLSHDNLKRNKEKGKKWRDAATIESAERSKDKNRDDKLQEREEDKYEVKKKMKRKRKKEKGGSSGYIEKDINEEEKKAEKMRKGEEEKSSKEGSKTNKRVKKAENMRKGEEEKSSKERSKTNKRVKKASKSEEKDKSENKGKRKETTTGNNEEAKNSEDRKKRKKVQFSDEVEVFSARSGSVQETKKPKRSRDECEGLVWGERFTEEEDAVLLKAIDDYIQVKQLGENGREMVYDSRKHKLLKGCWKEFGDFVFLVTSTSEISFPFEAFPKELEQANYKDIVGIYNISRTTGTFITFVKILDLLASTCLPHRPYESIYFRGRNLLRRNATNWTPEDYENLKQFRAAYGHDWRKFGDLYFKNCRSVKDAWRRAKYAMRNRGNWNQEEYQTLFNLVNLDLKLKAFTEEPETHAMLRDNISWEAVSDKLQTRTQSGCCVKWYCQLTSPLVRDNLWADTDDYRLILALQKVDAICIEDVDWDNLLPHRVGELCLKRWLQMVRYIGEHKERPFIEKVEILAKRYCPEMLEYRVKNDEELI